jgi:type IV fimbrial biogenesis protein FimT
MNKNSGFTIMELMVAIAIVGILSAVAVPNMIAWRNNMQFNSAVRMVKVSIEGTRMAAIRSNMPAHMEFTVGGDSFDTVRWDPIANAFAPPVTIQLPPGTILAGSTLGGNRLQFNGRGMPTNAFGGTLRIENTTGSLCRRIIVANLGSSRIDDCP